VEHDQVSGEGLQSFGEMLEVIPLFGEQDGGALFFQSAHQLTAGSV